MISCRLVRRFVGFDEFGKFLGTFETLCFWGPTSRFRRIQVSVWDRTYHISLVFLDTLIV